MRTYELMTIHRPELAEDDVRSRVSAIEESVTGKGGVVESTDFWGKRRFAYEIDHLTEGYYAVINFQAEPEAVEELDRTLGLTDEVLRHKVVKTGD